MGEINTDDVPKQNEADRIERITNRAVHTDLAEGEIESLPPYTEEQVYHLGWGGLFRKHPEWRQD